MAGQGGNTHGDAAAPVQEGAHVARHAVTTARHLRGAQAKLLGCIERRTQTHDKANCASVSIKPDETGPRLPPVKLAGFTLRIQGH